jgi:hypothetical protein
MEYILQENVMNGSVVIDSYLSKIESKNFSTAIKTIKRKLKNDNTNFIVDREDDYIFQYTIIDYIGYDGFVVNQEFPLIGIMKNEELKCYKE